MALTPADVELASRALALKRTIRKGWTRVPGLRDPESVAEHSWGVAFLAFLASARDPTLDAARLLRIALVHDLAEAVTGDLVPADYRDAEEKRRREEAAFEAILRDEPAAIRAAVLDAFRDYEEGTSREGRLVADLDKLEMAVQARAYAREGADAARLAEFYDSARARIRDATLRSLVDAPGA